VCGNESQAFENEQYERKIKRATRLSQIEIESTSCFEYFLEPRSLAMPQQPLSAGMGCCAEDR
jgi:hypothetical protein